MKNIKKINTLAGYALCIQKKIKGERLNNWLLEYAENILFMYDLVRETVKNETGLDIEPVKTRKLPTKAQLKELLDSMERPTIENESYVFENREMRQYCKMLIKYWDNPSRIYPDLSFPVYATFSTREYNGTEVLIPSFHMDIPFPY